MVLVLGQEEEAGKQGNHNGREKKQYDGFHAFEYIVTQSIKAQFAGWIPYVIGAILVVQFAGLGVWQVSRGFEKAAEREAFADRSSATRVVDGMEVRPYQPIRAEGRLLTERQFLLDNIILNSRYGYYVITPFYGADDEPPLLVNRGWIAKTANAPDAGVLDVPEGRITVRGRAGALPRAGFKMGDAVSPDASRARARQKIAA